MILIYLIALAVGISIIVKLLVPELKSEFNLNFLFAEVKLPSMKKDMVIYSKTAQNPKQINTQTAIKNNSQPSSLYKPVFEMQEKIARLENLLTEKTKEINRLQFALQAQQGHRHEFEKIQNILENEIQKLRDHNRILKLELNLHNSSTQTTASNRF